jgi:arginine deiminase
VADLLIGGITPRDIETGGTVLYQSTDPAQMILPPLPNFIFQRDPSSWLFDGVTVNPMARDARRPETTWSRASTGSTRCSSRRAG